MNISGSVGYTLLFNKKTSLHVLVFADIHDGVKYCVQDNAVMISDFLKKSHNNNILLEES